MAAEPAPITPITKNKAKAKTQPRFELKPVDTLPELVKPSTRLADRVVAYLDGERLGDAWHELIHYATPFGSGGAASRLNKAPELADYEFAARGPIVYIRPRPE